MERITETNRLELMKAVCIFFIAALFVSNFAQGQPEYWEPISHLGNVAGPGTLAYSENLGLCLNTSSFVLESGRKYIAGYDGDNWVTIADSVGAGFKTFVDFSNGILIGGTAPYIGTQHMPYVAYFDGDDWSYPYVFNGSVSKLKWVNDTLFALGHFTEIDGMPAYKIARLVDGVWEGVLEPYDDLSWTMFADIEYFEGEYYVGGNFESVEGPDDFAILRDGMLHEVGQGLTGSWVAIASLEIYQDNLYLAGSIPMLQGNIGDHILRWDGENYHALAGPFLNEQGNQSVAGADIIIMKVHDDYLYIIGSFHYIDDGHFNQLARWDGTKWCGLHTNHLTEGIFGFDFIEDQLLLRSPTVYSLDPLDYDNFILYLGGDEVSSCSTPLSSTMDSEQHEISIYPNPVFQSSGSEVSITSSVNFSEILVFDLAGRLVLQERMAPTSQYNVNLRGVKFAPGAYIVRLGGDGQWRTQKIVVLE